MQSRMVVFGALGLSAWLVAVTAAAQSPGLPAVIDAPGAIVALRVHAEGAQIYACQPDTTGALRWAFREPIATLLQDGKTIGRHYAGPSWEFDDGTILLGKVLARAPAPNPSDIPWLKLDAMARAAKGHAPRGLAKSPLANVRLIQRIHTQGGVLEGECARAGDVRSVAYSADYVFLRG